MDHSKTEYFEIHVASDHKNKKKTNTWKKYLLACQQKGIKLGDALPIDAFKSSLIESFSNVVSQDVVFEMKHDSFVNEEKTIQVLWFAKIIKICGYKVLAQWLGLNMDHSFWVNSLADNIYSVGHAQQLDPAMDAYTYAPPLLSNEMEAKIAEVVETAKRELEKAPVLGEQYDSSKKTMLDSSFQVGQRLELLSYNDSRVIRPARIHHIAGRRMNVLVENKDFSGAWTNKKNDRQLNNRGAQFWVDKESCFIHPVGWAQLNGYTLEANEEYVSHSRKIAEALKAGKKPEYAEEDATPDAFQYPLITAEDWDKVKEGQKLELLDPLSQEFHDLKVATVIKKLATPGFVVIGMDGPDMLEDSLPLHVSSQFIFPVGFCMNHQLNLIPPPVDRAFDWSWYLADMRAEKMPVELFREEPSKERMSLVKVGARLEAAGQCENETIHRASIKSIHGRIVNITFRNYPEEFDELHDIDSHDILPLGWCEIHGYTLG